MTGRTEPDVIRHETRQAWEWLEGTVADVTADQANWWPPGTAIAVLKGLQGGVGWAETEGFRNPRPFDGAGDA